ncbi:helix-turn-helix domain-containing protein [Alkalihalobacillus clausii]|jgi:excisionase family DNA binding protein|uniref:helix-turn-helix domain-containing protein n=1 Tax=Shouchella clausii TaxID=79880 RepID=UPI001C24BD73|nr:helix-turn-helix domain-containing protein [Shouchella clausii]MBU8598456.1 helix-turn-helix domain-containing protein [Shouchella clausii]
MNKSTMNINEAASYLGVSVSTVRRWIKYNGLPVLKLQLGGRMLFKKDRLDAWIDEQMGEVNEVQEYEAYGNVRVLKP